MTWKNIDLPDGRRPVWADLAAPARRDAALAACLQLVGDGLTREEALIAAVLVLVQKQKAADEALVKALFRQRTVYIKEAPGAAHQAPDHELDGSGGPAQRDQGGAGRPAGQGGL